MEENNEDIVRTIIVGYLPKKKRSGIIYKGAALEEKVVTIQRLVLICLAEEVLDETIEHLREDGLI